MTWLDNPVANMYGPHFLLLYVAVVAVGLSALWYLLRRDSTAGEPAPPVPTEPDPYAVAYLRGGLGEVVRVAVFELMQRGYLESESGVYQTAPDAPDSRHLDGAARVVYEWFRKKDASLETREVFGAKGVAAEIKDQVEPALRQPLEAERLLATGETKRYRRRLTLVAVALLLGLGAYKLTVALTKGYTNVLFLVLLGVAALVAALVISATAPSVTTRGRKYLDALDLAFRQLTTLPETARESSYLPLMVGLFGASALAGTSYAFYADELEQLQRAAQSSFSGTSCGSSCGSSCGGGGCGGGCGGCGG